MGDMRHYEGLWRSLRGAILIGETFLLEIVSLPVIFVKKI